MAHLPIGDSPLRKHFRDYFIIHQYVMSGKSRIDFYYKTPFGYSRSQQPKSYADGLNIFQQAVSR
jgi:hypothetical protein